MQGKERKCVGIKSNMVSVTKEDFATRAIHVNTLFDHDNGVDQSLVQTMCEQVMHLMHNKQTNAAIGSRNATLSFANFADKKGRVRSTSDFNAGMNCARIAKSFVHLVDSISDINSWIIDTGVIDHMTLFHSLFLTIFFLPQPNTIHLPNGSTKSVCEVR